MKQPRQPSQDPTRLAGGDVAAAVSASVLSALPIFLVAALAEQIRAALHFDVAALGTLFSIYYLGAALASVPMSWAVEAVGALRAMRAGCAMTGVLLLIAAMFADSYWSLAVLMALTGPVSATLQPATNLFLIRRIPNGRRGLAFGLKQAAVPTAVSLSGLAVPTVALTVGWRWAFVAIGVLSLMATVFMPRSHVSFSTYRKRKPAARLDRRQIRRLLALTVGFALGVSAATALSSFAVTALVATGQSQSDAGLLAAAGGGIAGLTRVAVGLRADHTRGAHLDKVVMMLGIGGIAYATVALASYAAVPIFLLMALGLAFSAGWGWNGLFSLAIATGYPEQAARATALTSIGGRAGGVIGPFVFGMAATHGGYSLAWLIEAVAALTGAAVIYFVATHKSRQ